VGPVPAGGAAASLTAPDPVGLADTDVLVDHLRGHRRLVPGGVLAYSVVTRAELFAGAGGLDTVRSLLDAMVEVPVDRPIAEAAGALRRERGLGLADALIAATAVRLGVPLLTRNGRHFKGVTGLAVTAPGKP
jgi:predicted nucleic acid-binding protein